MLCANLYITNLSNVTLTEAQVRLLNKGFGFAPAARDANTFELLRDFNQFCWKLCKFSKTRTRRGVLNKYSCGKIKKKHLNSKGVFSSNPTIEGILGVVKNKISNIYTTDNILDQAGRWVGQT